MSMDITQILVALGLPSATPYVGAIGRRGAFPNAIQTNQENMSRTVEFLTESVPFQLVFTNYWTNVDTETANASAVTLCSQVKYNGAFYPVTYSGSRFGVMPAGSPLFMSDPISIPGYKIGDPIYIDTYSSAGTGGTLPVTNYYYTTQDQSKNSGNTVTNSALAGGDWTGDGGNIACFKHVAIVGTTAKATIAKVGDSRMDDIPDAAPFGAWYAGEAVALSEAFACIGLARSTSTLAGVVDGTNFNVRKQFLQFVTHAITNYGTNDLVAGKTAAQIITMRQTLVAQNPGVIWWHNTVSPRVTSTDNFVTLANQTAIASESERVKLNDQIRGGVISGYVGYFDTADQVESSRNSGKWAVISGGTGDTGIATTTDGTHANVNGFPRYRNAYGFGQRIRR